MRVRLYTPAVAVLLAAMIAVPILGPGWAAADGPRADAVTFQSGRTRADIRLRRHTCVPVAVYLRRPGVWKHGIEAAFTYDPCEEWWEPARTKVPPCLLVTAHDNDVAIRVKASNCAAVYDVRVAVDGGHVDRQLLVSRTAGSRPREFFERIYEGTDAFVNYCIDKGREIRSANGRLFCVRRVQIRHYGSSVIEWRSEAE